MIIPIPLPKETLKPVICGLGSVLHTKPLSVTSFPPSDTTSPLIVAEEIVISVISSVVTTGKDGSSSSQANKKTERQNNARYFLRLIMKFGVRVYF